MDPQHVSAATARTLPQGSRWREEAVATLRLSVPLALSQLTAIAITTTDILVLGRLGARDLAAASLGHALYWPCFLFGMGVASAASPLVAQALGARRHREARRAAQQGLIAAFLSGLALMPVLWSTAPILEAMGQRPELAADAQRFTRALSWGLPFAVGFIALRSFTTAFNRTRAVLVVTLAAVVLNALLNLLLVFGGLGLPALGIVGSGTASSIVNTLMFLTLLIVAVREPPFRRYALLGRLFRPDPAMLARTFRLGLPIAGGIVLETLMFSAAAFLMGRIGTVELAAHQITLQIAAVTFMVPLGVGLAATIRVAQAEGAGDARGARLAGFVAVAIGLGFMAAAALTFVALRWDLVALFTRGDDPLAPEVVRVAAALMLIAALFQLADGLQVISMSALRGLRDTAVPMVFAAIGYWGVGFPTAWWLGLHTPLREHGVWLGIALGLATSGVLLAGRFLRLSASRTAG